MLEPFIMKEPATLAAGIIPYGRAKKDGGARGCTPHRSAGGNGAIRRSVKAT